MVEGKAVEEEGLSYLVGERPYDSRENRVDPRDYLLSKILEDEEGEEVKEESLDDPIAKLILGMHPQTDEQI